MRGGGVVVVHPGKQHAYQVALALHRAARLRQFITGIYYKPEAVPYSVVRSLPSPLRTPALRELGKRVESQLPSERVRSWPYAELFSRAIGRAGWLGRASRGRAGYPFVNWATDLYASRVIVGMHPRPDAIYGFFEAASRTFACARRLGIQTILDVPIIVEARETVRREYRALGLGDGLLPPPSRTVAAELALTDWVMVPSAAVADSVRRAGFAGRGIFVVPFGADPAVFAPAPPCEGSRRFRAVFAGRLEVRKGLHYLLEAWRTAAIDGELVLAGSPGEREFVDRLRRQYGGMFVEAGNLVASELAALFSTADTFVLPSLAEGSALVTYQALAAGLPCIVTEEAGSIVRDGVEGFVIPARDANALSERLRLLSSDHDLRRRMARAAAERGREFTWQRYHQELAAAIDVALDAAGARTN